MSRQQGQGRPWLGWVMAWRVLNRRRRALGMPPLTAEEAAGMRGGEMVMEAHRLELVARDEARLLWDEGGGGGEGAAQRC